MLKKDFSNRGKKLSKDKTSGNKEALSLMGIYRNRDKE